MDIIEVISDHSEFIEEDYMALFFCLYFCIYYNNPEMVVFLKTLIKKMRIENQDIDYLLEQIELNGVQRLRTVGEQLNQTIYHMVMYQAFNEDLRVVYS